MHRYHPQQQPGTLTPPSTFEPKVHGLNHSELGDYLRN